jgi:hypothetical protein
MAYNTASCCSGEKIDQATQCCVQVAGYDLREVVAKGVSIASVGKTPEQCPNRAQLQSFPPGGQNGSAIDGCSVPSMLHALFSPELFIADPNQVSSNPMAVSYYYACANHDRCYQTCRSAQGTCDSALKEELYTSCNAIPVGQTYRIFVTDPTTGVSSFQDVPLRNLCLNEADMVYAGLYVGGFIAHNQRQREVCSCCGN